MRWEARTWSISKRACASSSATPVLANRASCLAYLGRFEQAIRDPDSAIEIAPRAEAYVSRGRMRAIAGDREGAREDAQQAVKLDPRASPFVDQLLRDP